MDPEDDFEAERPRRASEHWAVLAVASLGALGLALFPLLFAPDARGYGTHEQLGLKPCYPLEAWRFPCPGCGVTTSIAHATRGDLLGALSAQPFGLALALSALAFFLWALVGQIRGCDLWLDLVRWNWPRLLQGSLGLMALAWLYKIAAVRGWL